MTKNQQQKLTDIEKRMVKLEAMNDYEEAHASADDLLLDALRALGCPETLIEAYGRVGKWYA